MPRGRAKLLALPKIGRKSGGSQQREAPPDAQTLHDEERAAAPDAGAGAEGRRRKGVGKKGKPVASRENMLIETIEQRGDRNAMVELAQLYHQRREWQKAVHWYKRSGMGDAVIAALAECYFYNREPVKAQFLYQDAVKRAEHVRNPSVWYHLGVLYERTGADREAEYCLHHSENLLPPLGRDREIACRLAGACARLGKTPDCMRFLRAALEAPQSVSPRRGGHSWLSDEAVWFELGGAYQACADDRSAAKCFAKAEMPIAQASSWAKLGREYVALGEVAPAIETLGRAVQMDDSSPQNWWALAEAYCLKGNPEEAVAGLGKVGDRMEKSIQALRAREEDAVRRAKRAEEQVKMLTSTLNHMKAKVEDGQAESGEQERGAEEVREQRKLIAEQAKEMQIAEKIYQKRELVWESREREWRERFEQQEQEWQERFKGVQAPAPLQEMHEVNQRLAQENASSRALVSQLELQLKVASAVSNNASKMAAKARAKRR